MQKIVLPKLYSCVQERKVKLGDFGSAMQNGKNIPITTLKNSMPEIKGNKLIESIA